ncbi:MAG TPA: cation transporter [Rhizobiales bacterium]|nr:cation transporter [Hyphomicrobiales bacterium]
MKSSVRTLALGSIAVGIAVLGLKYLAWLMTGSVALYSDALESIVNVAAAAAMYLAVRLAAKPPDENHPFGHQKAEYFSAVFEGVLIVVAAISIFREAYSAFHGGMRFAPTTAGLLVNAAASVLNGAWSYVLVRQGRRLSSPALVADGYHLFTDVITSVGVLGGVVLARVTGLFWLDPLLAIAVAVNILWMGWRLIRRSLSSLMDEAASPQTKKTIERLINENARGAIEAHALRTRLAGPTLFVDFHLVVPDEMTVIDAHHICDRIEAAISKTLGDVNITIHVEPEDEITHKGAKLVF